AAAGALTPGGPYVSMPIVAGLLRSGASMGTMVAYMTGWSLWAFGRLPMEIGILGFRFALIRLISVMILPPIAGFFAQFISKVIR
ncbi:MAG: permease, partial [Candidatus Omnitrophota bacterium]